MRLIFRAYDRDDSLLGTLTEATAKRISVHYNGTGTGAFRINRNSSQAAWCEPDNYVRVYIDSTSNDPIFGFFIESGNDTVLSRDEKGGQEYQRGGRGGLAYLERAIIDASSTLGRFAGTSWTWTNPTHGRIVKELIDDAQLRTGLLPLLTIDFDETDDSDSDAWTTITGTYELPVGLDLLAAIERQQSAGLVVKMSPDFVLSARQAIGTDRSATVIFEEGVNIAEEVSREVLASSAKSRMLVQGTTTAGVPFFRWVADTTVEAALGDRREGFVSYQATANTTIIDRVGAQAIRRLKRRHDGLSTLGVTMDDFVPFTDYFPGDTVNIVVPDVWDDLDAPITAIVMYDNEAGDAECALEFEDIAFEPLALKDRTDPTPAGGGSGGGGGGASTPTGNCGDCEGCGCEAYDNLANTFTANISNVTVVDAGRSAHVAITPASVGAEFRTKIWVEFTGTGGCDINFTGCNGLVGDVITGDTWGAILRVLPGGATIYATVDASNSAGVSVSASDLRGQWINLDFILDALNEVSARAYLGTPGAWMANKVGAIFGSTGPDVMMVSVVALTGSVATVHFDFAQAPGGASDDFTRTEVATWGTGQLGAWGSTDGFPDSHFTVGRFGTPATPAPRQWVYDELVGTGDGAETDYTTEWPYFSGSLRVRVDTLPETNIVRTDPAAGEFSFSSPPFSGEVIRVDYQADT